MGGNKSQELGATDLKKHPVSGICRWKHLVKEKGQRTMARPVWADSKAMITKIITPLVTQEASQNSQHLNIGYNSRRYCECAVPIIWLSLGRYNYTAFQYCNVCVTHQTLCTKYLEKPNPIYEKIASLAVHTKCFIWGCRGKNIQGNVLPWEWTETCSSALQVICLYI